MSEFGPELKIGLSVINFLGPNLYSKISAVLSEMIANAWDADATEINIQFDLNEDKM